jgi:predicted nucleic acid-binding protein
VADRRHLRRRARTRNLHRPVRSVAAIDLAEELDSTRFELLDPDLGRVAGWVARGLTAYDASYVALAEQLGIPLVTVDRAILDAAPGLARLPRTA